MTAVSSDREVEGAHNPTTANSFVFLIILFLKKTNPERHYKLKNVVKLKFIFYADFIFPGYIEE